MEKVVYLCLSSLPAPPFHATEQALNTIRANHVEGSEINADDMNLTYQHHVVVVTNLIQQSRC